ncbi:Down syndrome cell adhesion molecule-like protein Dscam2 [Araneus ventricosus]|uniref:Down syndrome cell adhesion molecule-like protein Dscam2 n=1 Tax=Araneus ventricosus TaxID=182803 RepID=A0A4Y2IW20_ARAVE|nr:Down syndrome cell adhesion molecule-like protein Dscam2 [Araneus ventricosus]
MGTNHAFPVNFTFIDDTPREDQLDLLMLARAEAANNVYETHLDNQRRFDLHRQPHSFKTGDLVLYDWPKQCDHKLSPIFKEPFVIVRPFGPYAPQAPDKSALLAINSTFVVVRLSSWNDGGCPILYFEIRYKPKLQKEWILQSSNIAPAQATVTLSDLNPGTWYDLLMAAHNDADSTEAEYVFATLTASGATVPPLASTSSTSSGAFSILKDPAVFVPIVCAVVVVVVITVVVAVVMVLRRKDTTSECRSQDSGSSGGKGENLSMSSYGKVKRSDPSDDSQREPLYYPTPYATTQLSTYSESPNTSHCNTLRRHDGKGHEYDIPHRHAQVQLQSFV